MLYGIALDLGLDPDYELFAGQVDIDEVFVALPALERWRGFVIAHYDRGRISATVTADGDGDSDRQSPDGSLDTGHAVEIGGMARPSSREG
jgi:hypothetical protein